MTFASEGEHYCILLSEIHKSLCLITKKSALLKRKPSTDKFGLISKVLPDDVVALSGIVDDFLPVGPPQVVHDFLTPASTSLH